MNAVFLSVVEIEQYFMTSTLENNFMQWSVVNTLFQEKMDHHNEEDGSRNTKNWTRAGSHDQFLAWCSWSSDQNLVSERRQHALLVKNFAWIKFVMDSNNNDTEVPEDQSEEPALQLDVKDFAYRSKEKAKPQKKGTSPGWLFTKDIPIDERIDIEPGNYSTCIRSFEESDSSSSSFSASTSRRGWSGSSLQNKIFRVNFQKFLIDLTIDGKHAWQQEEEQKGDIKCRIDDSGTIVCFRSLQGHSGRNLIDPSMQDNVVIHGGFSIIFTTLDVYSIFALLSTMD